MSPDKDFDCSNATGTEFANPVTAGFSGTLGKLDAKA
jgi:hypothetical protein